MDMQNIIEKEINSLKDLFGEKFNNVSLILEQNVKDHGLIYDQVVKTNGRVTKLEKWRVFLIGAWTAVTVVIIPIGIYYIKAVTNQPQITEKDIIKIIDDHYSQEE